MIHDRFIRDALRAADPDEMRLVRGRQCGPHSGTMTLITTSDCRKNAFVDGLPDGRRNVSCIQHDGTYFWLVQAPSRAVQKALRQLGWTELPSSESSTEARAEPLKSRPEGRVPRERGPKACGQRRLCGAWGRRTRRR